MEQQAQRSSTLPVYWWRYNYPSKLNFGDEVTPYIIKRIFRQEVAWAPVAEARLIGAGSILEHCQEDRPDSKGKLAVWGSGFIHQDSEAKMNNFEYYAVRGKLSAEKIGKPGIVTGDPGILMSRAYPEYRVIDKRYDIGIIPHYVDADLPIIKQLGESEHIHIINALDSPLAVASQINQCRIIFSSSLHGLIFADSYGVPNYWTPLSDQLTGGSYKFNDYYSVYDEVAKEFDLLESVENWEALVSGFVTRDIRVTQEGLIGAFPPQQST